MKKSLLLCVCITLCSICMAQEATMVPTTRIGDQYILGTETMNKRAYRGYLQNTCPEAFSRFDKGYKTAMAGWGLMAAGPVISLCIGFPTAISAGFPMSPYYTEEEMAALRRRSSLQSGFGIGTFCLGAASVLCGVICVSVGYGQMHQATDIYNHNPRIGNQYMVGNEIMGKRAYRGYLQNTCPEAFTQFDKAYKTAMAGWGLMAAGPVLVGGCLPFSLYSFYDYSHNSREQQRLQGTCISLTCLGFASLVSGIVCVSVGYSRMHQAADLYNAHCAQHTTYWTIEGKGDQLCLALHF